MAKLTQEERDRARFEALKKELQELAPKMKEHDRKRREGQLFAWGRYFEARYKSLTQNEKESVRNGLSSFLFGVDLTRALEGLDRLDKEAKASPSKASAEGAQ